MSETGQMQILRSSLVVLALIPALGMFAFAQMPQSSPPAPGSASPILHRLFAVKNVDGSLFASSFTAQIPTATVQTIVDGYRARLATFKSVEPAGRLCSRLRARFRVGDNRGRRFG